jgi:hypothetical protein
MGNVYNPAELPLMNFVVPLDDKVVQPAYWSQVQNLADVTDEAFIQILQGADRPSSTMIDDSLVVKPRPASAVRDQIVTLLRMPNPSGPDQLVRAVGRWPFDAGVGEALNQQLGYFRDPACLRYLTASRPAGEHAAVYQRALVVGKGGVLEAALTKLLADDRWDIIAQAMAEAKGRQPAVVADSLFRRVEKSADPKARATAVDIIAKHLNQEEKYCQMNMVNVLGLFGADAAPALSALKAINHGEDKNVKDARDKTIAAIEKAMKAKK